MSSLDRNLRALAICYRILGGLIALFAVFMVALMSGGVLLSDRSVPLANLIFPLLLLTAGGTMSVVAFEVAGALRDRERRTFCLVVGWLVSAFFPLGTVLGVFTILQLIRPDAERAFSEADLPYANLEDLRDQDAGLGRSNS